MSTKWKDVRINRDIKENSVGSKFAHYCRKQANYYKRSLSKNLNRYRKFDNDSFYRHCVVDDLAKMNKWIKMTAYYENRGLYPL